MCKQALDRMAQMETEADVMRKQIQALHDQVRRTTRAGYGSRVTVGEQGERALARANGQVRASRAAGGRRERPKARRQGAARRAPPHRRQVARAHAAALGRRGHETAARSVELLGPEL